MKSANRRQQGGFSLTEVLVALAVVGLVIGVVVWLLGFGTSSTGRLSSQLGLHQASRKVLVRLLEELQEGIEVITPPPGATLSFSVIRDKVSLIRWFYLRPQTGKPGSYELWRYVHDGSLPDAKRQELLLGNIRRLTFTSQSEGSLLINLVLADDGQQYGFLTTVRLRNLASAEELW